MRRVKRFVKFVIDIGAVRESDRERECSIYRIYKQIIKTENNN